MLLKLNVLTHLRFRFETKVGDFTDPCGNSKIMFIRI